MKRIDMFCASQASTAICMSMEQLPSSSSPSSSSSSSSSLLLGRAIDRYNPIIRDSKRAVKIPLPPCAAAEPPISPRPLKINQNKKNNKTKTTLKDSSSGDIVRAQILNSTERTENDGNGNAKVMARKSWSCTRPGGFISPPGSSRYLLSEKVFSNSHIDTLLNHTEISKSEDLKSKEEQQPPEQVVVLKVSLHCRGCEKKMKKHISRMEGVTSFNIDFMAKKVTVIGNVTPLGVLSSISKVKNAQLWPPTLPSSFPDYISDLQIIKTGYKVAAGA